MAFNRLLLICSIIVALFSSAHSHGEKSPRLIFSYWTDARPPFVFIEDGKLTGGILKEIGDELAANVGLSPHYIETPVKRIEQQLQIGAIHADCITNPIWKDTPDRYHWSPVLFKGADRFLVKKGKEFEINTFADLKGRRVGTYNGYVYHPDIMAMFQKGEAFSEQVAGIELGVRLVNLGRLDTLIDFGTLLEYQIKSLGLKDSLTLANQHADDFDLQCAFSKKLPVRAELLEQHLNQLIQAGFIKEVTSKYR